MKKLLFVALAALGFVACNNDMDEAAHSGEVETSYIAINLNAVDNSTRAEGGVYQEGDAAEREVKSAYFFFFDQYGNPFTVTAEEGKPATAPRGGVNWISASLTDTNDKTETTNVSDIKDAVLLLSTYVGMYPSQIIAVLNWAPTASEPYSLNDLYAATNIQGIEGAFVMSNAVYADGSKKEVVGTPLTSEYIHKSEAEAKAHPITIYVERIAAKVTVTAKEGITTNNHFKVERNVVLGGIEKAVYVEVLGWALHNDFTQSKLLKDINPTWENSELGFTWNDTPWHRCYWATSLLFEQIGSNTFPSTFSLQLGDNANVAAGTYIDKTYTYVGENTNYNTTDKTANCTKVIIKAKLKEKDGDTYKDLPLARWYSTYYAGEEQLRTAVANTIQYQYYWNESGSDSYIKIAPSDLKIVADDNMVKFQLSDDVTSKNWYIKTGDTYTSKTIEQMNTLLSGIEKAVYYKSGETLYSVDIAHLGYQLSGDQLGDYGVVRNHIYNIILKSFGGFGSPVYVPGSNLEYPDDPYYDSKDYVSAEVRVLSWRLVSQEVDVQPTPQP